MATYKYSEVFNGDLEEIFTLFMGEAVRTFSKLETGYFGSKQVKQTSRGTMETEITGYELNRFYQVTVRLHRQEYVMSYTFTQVKPNKVRLNYVETFRSKNIMQSFNNWLMRYLMRKSLKAKVVRSLQPLRQVNSI